MNTKAAKPEAPAEIGHQFVVDHLKTHKLSEWERQFHQACRARLANGRGLSPLMSKKLMEIWNRQGGQ